MDPMLISRLGAIVGTLKQTDEQLGGKIRVLRNLDESLDAKIQHLHFLVDKLEKLEKQKAKEE